MGEQSFDKQELPVDWCSVRLPDNTAQRLFHEIQDGYLTVRKQDVIVYRSPLDVPTMTNAIILIRNLIRAGANIPELENLKDIIDNYNGNLKASEDKGII